MQNRKETLSLIEWVGDQFLGEAAVITLVFRLVAAEVFVTDLAVPVSVLCPVDMVRIFVEMFQVCSPLANFLAFAWILRANSICREITPGLSEDRFIDYSFVDFERDIVTLVISIFLLVVNLHISEPPVNHSVAFERGFGFRHNPAIDFFGGDIHGFCILLPIKVPVVDATTEYILIVIVFFTLERDR